MAASSPDPGRIVRAVYRATHITDARPPYDNVTLKIFYPAISDDSDTMRNSGVVPPDTTHAPYPVVIFSPGINLGPEAYAWLAHILASAGIVTVTY